MKHFKINGQLNDEVATQFIAEADKDRGEGMIIYLTSSGGSVSCVNLLLHIINADPSSFHLVALEEIGSAAFELFFSVKCSTEIMPGTIGCFHHQRKSIDMLDTGQPYYDSDKFFWSQKEKSARRTMQFCQQIGFNEQELWQMEKSEDVYFSTQRLFELRKFVQDVRQMVKGWNRDLVNGAMTTNNHKNITHD